MPSGRVSVPNPPASIVDGIATMVLPCGRLALMDEADYSRLSGFRWHWNGQYVRLSSRRKTLLARAILWGMEDAGCPRVDHKDGNRLDNRRENLRTATQQQNCFNRAPQRTAKGAQKASRFKGVRRTKQMKWISRIWVHDSKRYRTLLISSSEEEAARAYDAAAIELHGEFARLNFPVVAPVGLEPTTTALEERCSIQMSYGATKNDTTGAAQ